MLVCELISVKPGIIKDRLRQRREDGGGRGRHIITQHTEAFIGRGLESAWCNKGGYIRRRGLSLCVCVYRAVWRARGPRCILFHRRVSAIVPVLCQRVEEVGA